MKAEDWFDAQQVAPDDGQFCIVIGETKTTNTISPYLTLYLKQIDTFQYLGVQKILIPREKARWWTPVIMPGKCHPMDKD